MTSNKHTQTYWEIEGDYGQGWECVTAADTLADARGYLQDYRTNDPQHAYRLRKQRVPKSCGVEP